MYEKHFNRQGLKYQFANIDLIEYNYSQADQDIFVLAMLDGKKHGTYLEIGCGWPYQINNTALLETKFDWQGVSIDTSPMYTDLWKTQRKNPAICADAMNIDYVDLLGRLNTQNKNFDYLSLDCDPPKQSFDILKTIPFELFTFAVITFEHDCYAYGPEIKTASRNYLLQHGYELVGADISECGLSVDFEDWYVHPDLVSRSIVEAYKDTRPFPKDYSWYLYGRIPKSLENTTFSYPI